MCPLNITWRADDAVMVPVSNESLASGTAFDVESSAEPRGEHCGPLQS
jgi:hypothetical protein